MAAIIVRTNNMLNSVFMIGNIKKEKLKVAKYYFKKYAIKQQDATKPTVIANKNNSVIYPPIINLLMQKPC